MSDLLKKIYLEKEFRSNGHALVDIIADHLENCSDENINVNNYLDPELQLDYWRQQPLGNTDILGVFKEIIERSIHLHHPKYMGHQISPPAPISALSALLTDIMNNGMGVYEMGGASTAIEKVVIETIAKTIGFDGSSDGFLTSGGTLANLTTLLTARAQVKDVHIWTDGMRNKNLALMVSEQAHYCIDRAVRIMGLGSEGIIKIPGNNKFQMRTDLLEEYYQKAVDHGKEIFAVVGSACTTSTGSYDDLEAIADFAAQKDIWFHVDGAHGGAVVFSEKYRSLVKGIARADSVIIDCHKMMMTPSVTTAVIYRNGQQSFSTFSQNANYLFEKEHDKEWHNLAKRTFECTKLMMGIKFYSILSNYGTQAIDEFVTTLYDIARHFADLIEKCAFLELANYPESNIVCYRYYDPSLSNEMLNELNSSLRKQILDEGEYYVVQTLLNGNIYLRNTMMNPFTSKAHIEGLIGYIREIAVSFQ